MESTDKPTSMQFDHCVAVYTAMKEQARHELLEPTTMHERDVPDERVLIYEGHLTKLFASLELPAPYYTSVMNHLKAMNCVEQLRRGGGNSPSRWALYSAPTEESFNSIQNQKRLRQGKVAVLEQQSRDLIRQLRELENKLLALEIRVGGIGSRVERLEDIDSQSKVVA